MARKKLKSAPPDDLTDHEKRLFWQWLRCKYPRWATPQHARDLVDGCLDVHRAAGNVKVDWLATCRTYVRNQYAWGHYPTVDPTPTQRMPNAGGRAETPQDPRPRQGMLFVRDAVKDALDELRADLDKKDHGLRLVEGGRR